MSTLGQKLKDLFNFAVKKCSGMWNENNREEGKLYVVSDFTRKGDNTSLTGEKSDFPYLTCFAFDPETRTYDSAKPFFVYNDNPAVRTIQDQIKQGQIIELRGGEENANGRYLRPLKASINEDLSGAPVANNLPSHFDFLKKAMPESRDVMLILDNP